MRLPTGITAKLTYLLVLTTGLLLAVVSGLSYTVGRSALEADSISELLAAGIEKESAINNWIDETKQYANSITVLPSLQKNLENLSMARAAQDQAGIRVSHDNLVAELRAWTGSDRDYLDLMILDANSGEVIVSTDAEQEGGSYNLEPSFLRGSSGHLRSVLGNHEL